MRIRTSPGQTVAPLFTLMAGETQMHFAKCDQATATSRRQLVRVPRARIE
jgi:hypothetical protein